MRALVFTLAAILALGVVGDAQSQPSNQNAQPNQNGASQGSNQNAPANQNSKPQSSSSSNDNPDDLLNAPMTPPRSDDATKGTNQDQKSTKEEFPFPEDEEKGNYSSSKDSQGDLGPPSNDASHPGGDVKSDANDGVMEMKPWNPHEADKDVEVGLFYFRRGNYHAAEARYRDALTWQENNAEANYRLAVVLEKLGRRPEAAVYYERYLKILPRGPFAAESRKALSKIDDTSGDSGRTPGKKTASTSPPS